MFCNEGVSDSRIQNFRKNFDQKLKYSVSINFSCQLNKTKNSLKQVLRNFKFYQTLEPRPLQNSNTFFFSKSLKTNLKIYFNQFGLILFKKKNFLRSCKNIIRGDPYKKILIFFFSS
jgi:hypothetical protein